MEFINKGPNKVKGIEILFFDNAELEKVKSGVTSFATSGPLSVLYFKEYNRFVLHLNDWLYPLMRRLPVLGQNNEDANNRFYSLPALNGFAYNLRIHKEKGSFAFQNLDAIFENNSRLDWKNRDLAFRMAEQSPDDKLVRHPLKEKSTKEVISQNIKHGIQHMKNKVETLKTGTKNLTSLKKPISLKDIKTRNFRKDTKSKLKQSMFDSTKKQGLEFWQMRRANLNNIITKKYDDLRKTSDSHAPSVFLTTEVVEEAILDNKDIITQGMTSFFMALQPKEQPIASFISEINPPESSVSQSIVGQGPMEAHGKSGRQDNFSGETKIGESIQSEIMYKKLSEGLSHYQG